MTQHESHSFMISCDSSFFQLHWTIKELTDHKKSFVRSQIPSRAKKLVNLLLTFEVMIERNRREWGWTGTQSSSNPDATSWLAKSLGMFEHFFSESSDQWNDIPVIVKDSSFSLSLPESHGVKVKIRLTSRRKLSRLSLNFSRRNNVFKGKCFLFINNWRLISILIDEDEHLWRSNVETMARWRSPFLSVPFDSQSLCIAYQSVSYEGEPTVKKATLISGMEKKLNTMDVGREMNEEIRNQREIQITPLTGHLTHTNVVLNCPISSRRKNEEDEEEVERADSICMSSQRTISCSETFSFDQSNRVEERREKELLSFTGRAVCPPTRRWRRSDGLIAEEINEVNERDLSWRYSDQKACRSHHPDPTKCCSPDEILLHRTRRSSSFLCHWVETKRSAEEGKISNRRHQRRVSKGDNLLFNCPRRIFVPIGRVPWECLQSPSRCHFDRCSVKDRRWC